MLHSRLIGPEHRVRIRDRALGARDENVDRTRARAPRNGTS